MRIGRIANAGANATARRQVLELRVHVGRIANAGANPGVRATCASEVYR